MPEVHDLPPGMACPASLAGRHIGPLLVLCR
jgi:hypothetical protein